jgi:hypothetical protein
MINRCWVIRIQKMSKHILLQAWQGPTHATTSGHTADPASAWRSQPLCGSPPWAHSALVMLRHCKLAMSGGSCQHGQVTLTSLDRNTDSWDQVNWNCPSSNSPLPPCYSEGDIYVLRRGQGTPHNSSGFHKDHPAWNGAIILLWALPLHKVSFYHQEDHNLTQEMTKKLDTSTTIKFCDF